MGTVSKQGTEKVALVTALARESDEALPRCWLKKATGWR